MKMKNVQKITFVVIALLSQTAFASRSADNNLVNAVLVSPNLAGVQAALAKGANPNLVVGLNSENHSSMLILAAEDNNTAIAEALIAKKANVNFQDDKGGTALIYAASNGNLELVNALLAAGANPNLQINAANNPTTALIVAAADNFTSVVEALVKALLKEDSTISKKSINAQDYSGSTALIYAVSAGNEAMVAALVGVNGNGIDANLQDNTGMTALMYAASSNSDLLPILQLLVKIPGINLRAYPKIKLPLKAL